MTTEPGFALIAPGDDPPAPEPEAPAAAPTPEPPAEIETAADAAQLRRVLKRMAVRAGHGVRAMRLPGVPVEETDAWIPRENELDDLMPALEGGAKSMGVAAGLVSYGPMIVAAFAGMTYVTRSVAAERPYRTEEPDDGRDAEPLVGADHRDGGAAGIAGEAEPADITGGLFDRHSPRGQR